MKVELLSFERCPSWRAMAEHLDRPAGDAALLAASDTAPHG